jgi:hypothetical protein
VHRVLNYCYFERHVVDIAWHSRLCEVEQGHGCSWPGIDTHRAVISEVAELRKQLGFLVDAESLYPGNELAAH